MFIWIPRHVRIKGIERADKNDKQALRQVPENYQIQYTDQNPLMKKHIKSMAETME